MNLVTAAVAVLYANPQSVYFQFPQALVYTEAQDARSYDHDLPVIAHPPCRLWCRLRQFAKAPAQERLLAYHALSQVRRCGGILEHPAYSRFWTAARLPAPRCSDNYGFTLQIDQARFGHRAAKCTWLYFAHINPDALQPAPLPDHIPTRSIDTSNRKEHHKKRLPHAERTGTPLLFAQWLITVAVAARPPTCSIHS